MSKKFATLGDVNGRKEGADSGEESDGEEGQSFYVGGSEHSGQQVVGPPSRGGEGVADRLFRAARGAGAETVDPSLQQEGARSSAFGGGGVKLGDHVQGSQAVAAAPIQESDSVDVTMVSYENGFTLNDGEFRAFEDPAQAAFLTEISRGQLPRELMAAYPGKVINMRMERRAGDYVPPKVRVFAGSGGRLGAVVPEVVGAGAPPAPSGEPLQKEAQEATKTDESKPCTQIQIRLPDGRRIVARLNTSATVSDVRAFIAIACPWLAMAPFELRTSYPNAPIANESLSLVDASLLNAVVVVRASS